MEKFKVIESRTLPELNGQTLIETEEETFICSEPFCGSWTDDIKEYETGLVDLLVIKS